ncbi:tripartite tricarboxylate transporter permease [Kocuria flava]|uniref:tripartite tricarboxylate transporter permease n=1 Tax=Kocuria flava TaxID=446860 RepID=UPI001FF6BE18|nr:tripartite tricarboxylate transporter permease [Kocuria flava]MCJ8503978.1 tripartite tricarboxylate transporter permease [Kocuria flava]
MDILEGLASGFLIAFSPTNLLYVTLGVLIGTVIGLIPGLGPVAAIALLLPLTFELDPATAIMMLAGIYYGSMYGGRIPAILLRLPGDASAVVTTFDGYPLAQQGKAGPALGITAIGSFLGGTVAIIGLSFLAPTLAGVAGGVGAPDLFALALIGLLMIAFIGSGSKFKALAVAGLGILVATVGLDPISGQERLTFGSTGLLAGVDIVAVAVGMFGIGEILYNAEHGFYKGTKGLKLTNKLPSRADWVLSRFAILRGSVIGFFVGILPGGGGTISSVLAYGVERRVSKRPEKFGKGAIEGLAATETADNASSNSAFIPLLTLGIPPNPVLALIFGALLLQNITPGPNLVNEHPDVFWGVIASMYIGNILLLILNLPLIGVFVQMLRVRGSLMAPIILIVSICGVYSVRNSLFDVLTAIVFGVVGYLLRKVGFDLGPFILGFILGPILEVQFRRSMLMSDGSFSVFLERPLTLMVGVVIVGAIFASLVSYYRRRMARFKKQIHYDNEDIYI